MRKWIWILAALVGLGISCTAWAQQNAPAAPTATIKRVLLQRLDVPASNYETVTATAELLANASAGRHTHPGPETGYMLEGELTILIDGKPPLTLKPGDTYQIPSGAIHDVRAGDKGGKVFAVYIIEKGKPLASPAP